jgi:hypothetical protein
MCFKRKNKPIYLYVITDNSSSEDSTLNICSVTATIDEATEYIKTKLVLDNFEHFKLWAELHNKEITNKESWVEYFNDVISPENKTKYIISRYKYTIQSIASILRMFNSCPPVGASYETATELSYFKNLYSMLSVKAEGVDK